MIREYLLYAGPLNELKKMYEFVKPKSSVQNIDDCFYEDGEDISSQLEKIANSSTPVNTIRYFKWFGQADGKKLIKVINHFIIIKEVELGE